MDIENGSQDGARVITSLAISSLALSRGDRTLFRDLDLATHAGEAVALTGANGAGKTSLLRAIAGFIHPDAGEIVFTGKDGALDPQDARHADIHLLGHLDGLKASRTARQELGFAAPWLGGEGARIDAAVDRLKLRALLDLEVRRLSAGQRRRLALARLVAAPRTLWLLDEPFAPLDAQWRAVLAELMAEHLTEGGVIVAAVHDPLPVSARVVAVEAPR